MSPTKPRNPEHHARPARRRETALAPGIRSDGIFGRPLIVGLLLAVVTVAVYWPATGYDFVICDDGLYVTGNPRVLQGLTLKGMVWAFGTLHAANWHPLTWLSHMLDVTLFGTKSGAHHLTNTIFHSANTVLLFACLWRMTGALWRSALVAALFALHPLHVESVAWVSERKDVLSTCFGLLALLCYADFAKSKAAKIQSEQARSRNGSSARSYWLALVFFTFGLLSKPMLVTWPFLMLLLDYWPLQRFSKNGGQFPWWHLVREKTPFLILSLGASIVTVIAQTHGGAVQSLERFPFGERAQNAVVSYVRYLGKMFWPVNLIQPYPPPERWPVGEVLLCSLLILGLSVVAFRIRRRWPFLFVGWFLFLGMLVPVIGLVQVGLQSMADRYTYVPLVGIFIVVVWGIGAALSRWRLPGKFAAVGAVLVLASCAIVTRHQLGFWQNSGTLLRHTIAVTKNNPIAYYDLACYLESKGQIDTAMENYQRAILIRPDYAKALNNVGKILADEGHRDEAMDYYNRALRSNPDQVSALNNLGVALAGKGQYPEAAALYEKAIRQDPDFVYAHYNLGVALEARGQWEEALVQYQEALHRRPDYWEAHSALANDLMLHRRVEEAVPHLVESLRLNVNQPAVHFNLGNALAIQQKYAEAIQHFTECLKLSPGYAPARKNLGMALSRVGRREEAINQLNEAIRLKPDYEEAKQQLRELGVQTGE